MTVITLYQDLLGVFPGFGDEHAAAKLHVVQSVSTGLPDQFTITDGLTHEITQFATGPWVEGSLLLFDQAYFKYRTMDLIDTNGGWFVTRVKPNANPTIVDQLREWRGNAISLEGEQLQAVLDDLHQDVIDVDGDADADGDHDRRDGPDLDGRASRTTSWPRSPRAALVTVRA